MSGTPALRLTRSTFLRVSAAFTVASVLVWSYVAVVIAGSGGATKVLGWSATRQDSAWVVREVAPDGPAAGVLLPGDRLLAIDGDSAVQRIGPRWILRDNPDKREYRLTIARANIVREHRLDWPIRSDAALYVWRWIHFVTGVVYGVVGLIIAFAKPDSLAARRAVLSSVLSSAFFVTATLYPNGGMVGGLALPLALIAFMVLPFHLLAGYRFNAAFPLEQPSTGKWRRFEQVMWAACLLLWVPSVYGAILRSLGPERAVPIVAAQVPFSLLHDALVESLNIVIAAVLSLANALVCRRNYLAVTEPGLKRRLRWVSIGIGVGMIPILVVAPLLVIGYAAGYRVELETVVRAINTATIIIPLCIAYAVLKHQVLGIKVVLRAGVRYLMARHVLGAVLILPLALLVYTVVTNPSLTIAELAVGPSARLNLTLAGFAGLGLAFRRPLLQLIDRRFFREAYHQDRIFVALAEAINHAADVTEISRLLSSQIEAALHPRVTLAVSCEERDEFSLLYSSGPGGTRVAGDLQMTPSDVDRLLGSTDVADVPALGRESRAALQTLGISLLVPVRGPNEGLVGLVLLGPKLSDEPYTGNDRRLLDTVASQTGVVWENLRLRARLKREQGARREVVARLDGAALLMECEACGACYDAPATRCERDGRELTPSLPIARTLGGKYRLTRLIGRGGMGAVYEALDLRLERTVAVKVTVGTLFDDAVMMQRFAREARASARLDHPNVVRAFDLGELPAGAYLVLEYLRGHTLRRELQQRGRLPFDDAVRVLKEVLAGVEAAHARGIVHRDLKPENIFLAEGAPGEPRVTKILDFGLAAVRDAGLHDRQRLTQTGVALGTLAYMPVEQFLGEPADERVDLYALGVVALEVLSGELPSKGPTFSSIGALIDERLGGGGTAAGDGPRELARVLRRATAEHRDARYQSVAALRDDLFAALRLTSRIGDDARRVPSAPSPS